MRCKPDEFSSHPYEVKNLYMKGSSVKTIFFYLRAGEAVDIKIEAILKKTNIWLEPTEFEPKREYPVFFEIEQKDSVGAVDLYMSSFTAELKKDTA